MKQLLIQILSALVGNEAKIEIKTPKINFKEGFRRIVAVCCLIGFVCGACSGEFVTALSCSVLSYLGYLCIEVLFCWIGSGFSGQKAKRTLLKEWQIKYKYWNRKCQRKYREIDSRQETESHIQYNRNPFVPKGRMRRFDFFVYSFLFNIVIKMAEYELEQNQAFFGSALFLVWLVFIVDLFIVRNRIYDITLSNKKAWCFSCLFQLSGFVLTLFHQALIYLMLPFGFALMIIPSKLEKATPTKKEKEQSAFDMIKTIRN